MKKFWFKVLFFLLFVLLVFFMVQLILAQADLSRRYGGEGSSVVFSCSDRMLVYISPECNLSLREIELTDEQTFFFPSGEDQCHAMTRYLSPFNITQTDDEHVAIFIAKNGSYLVLNYTTVCVLLVVGWGLIIAVVVTFGKDFVGEVKLLFTNIKNKFKKKEKQE